MFFRYQGEDQSLISIDRKNKKRRGRSRYLLSVEVEIIKDGNAIPAKLVYVRNRNNRKDYLCLLSTDLSLEENEIIRLYGKRWEIEVFFKVCKKLNTDFLEKRAPVLPGITAQDADTAAVCDFGSENAFDGCTFSCSVCAEHSEDLPLSGLNAQITYWRFVFVSFCKIFYDDYFHIYPPFVCFGQKNNTKQKPGVIVEGLFFSSLLIFG